ncbi:hypothetical protein [Desulfotruncus alcoholivorax]|uniref:hypothetical protein n=1 Tax=Desulfotruncus alcoholivorax TaxID=265477 RepID=UPI000409C0CD|nr:hypothetical protein [Desulfotruncus alcoholivorax]
MEKNKMIVILIEENQRLAEKLEQLTGVKNHFAHMLFGRSSEKNPEINTVDSENLTATEITASSESSAVPSEDDKTVPASVDDNQPEPATPQNNVLPLNDHSKRKRGAQPGHKGNGRKIHENLRKLNKNAYFI